tara:strand:- start:9867 stop:10130 length:264 start_codon:yes stop_codon:yes gene_type:complete
MSVVDLDTLLTLLGGDSDLLEELAEHGLIAKECEVFSADDVETVLVSQTLVRELEVNWAGVDVILRMRKQLLVTRLRLSEISKGRDS